MRGVSLMLVAENNRLIKEFSEKVYPFLPEGVQGYYNAVFDMNILRDKAVEEVSRNMLSCKELTTQPDFDIEHIIEIIDKVLPDIIRAIEYGQTHSICWHINKSVLKLIRLKGYKYKRLRIRRIRGIGYYAGFAWKKETVSLIENNRLPKNYYGLETLRAYCEYLKAEALKQPSEQPEDIEPPDEIKKYFEEYPQYFELSKYPIDGKKRYFALESLESMTVSKVVKNIMPEWVYNIRTKKPFSPDSIKNYVEGN